MRSRTVNISVGDLVAYVLRSGDRARSACVRRLRQGVQGHKKVQAERDRERVEVTLSLRVEREEVALEIAGRADVAGGNEVEEIKTTQLPPEELGDNPYHWGQAMLYGYMLARRDGLEAVMVRLTYLQLDSGDVITFTREMRTGELEEQFRFFTDAWFDRRIPQFRAQDRRMEGLLRLQFPFGEYRQGQRDMMEAIERAIRDGGETFVQAPTGTGKTMASLYPALKALGEGLVEKVFYLTAKSTTRTVAEDTLDRLREAGATVRSVTLTARERCCFSGASRCKGRLCPYGRGYFNRAEEALRALEGQNALTRRVLEEAARKYQVCPHELALDASETADVIIGDYSHAFDPRASLKRYFVGGGNYALLVDEAHNLVERAREMFSATLSAQTLVEARRALGLPAPETEPLLQAIAELVDWFKQARRAARAEEKPVTVSARPPEDLAPLVQHVAEAAEPLLPAWGEVDSVMELFYTCRQLLRTDDAYDGDYCTYVCHEPGERGVTLFCMDPARRLRETLGKVRATAFFSATMSPDAYYREMLGSGNAPFLDLPSPFPRENFCPLILPLATRYSARGSTYGDIAEALATFVEAHEGHYMFFFPSYAYLRSVHGLFRSLSETPTLCQTAGMREQERRAFLDAFARDDGRPLAGFAVMGGVFGEGIDLIGDRLSGVAVVGVGLPQIGLTRELLRMYFEETRQEGYAYAYVYPGFNKVQQAVGRLIRSDEDYGAVLLIDDRLPGEPYTELFPDAWQPLPVLEDALEMAETLEAFWAQKPSVRS